jgi:hypothetical protein
MSDQITCPHCRKPFALDAALAAQLLERQRPAIVAEEARKAAALVEEQLRKSQEDVRSERERREKAQADLRALQKEQADLRRDKEDWDLEKRRQLEADRKAIREEVARRAQEEARLPIAEKEQLIQGLKAKIEELQQRALQGSQQLQGEAQELDLEAMLRAAFPHDAVEPVAKGQHGADVLQRVLGPGGVECGSILWESKRTKHWESEWLPKLRDDQRARKAEVSVLMSAALPKGVEAMAPKDGVWITSPACAVPLAHALRHALLEVAAIRTASEGARGKQELVYEYLSGAHFRQRIAGIVEAFQTMKRDLDEEKSVIRTRWAKREKQIERVLVNTSGLVGDLQAIAGRTLPEIDALEVKSLEAGTEAVTEAVEGPGA